MASRFWVGGTGSWDASTTTNWSATSGGAGGASAPTSADTATFDSLSNATLYTVTMVTGATCSDLNIAGPLSGNVTVSGGGTSNIYGNFTVSATGVTWSATGTMTFSSTTTGKTITTNNFSLAGLPITFNGVGGGWTLSGILTCSAIILVNGIFNTGSNNITCTSFTYTAGTAATFTLGSSTITCTSNTAMWSIPSITNLTFNAGTSTITLSATWGSLVPVFNTLTYNNVQFTGTVIVYSTCTFGVGNPTFNNLTFNATSAAIGRVYFTNNITISGTFTCNGTGGIAARIFFTSGTQATAKTITAAAVSISYCDFQDIIGAGTATWSGVSLGDCDGNSGITFPASKTVYWVGTTTAFYGDNWASVSGGSAVSSNYPLAQDIAIFNNAAGGNISFATAQGNNTQWGWNTGSIDMSARTSISWNISPYGGVAVYKNWTSAATLSMSGSDGASIIFSGRRVQTLTTRGNTWTLNLLVDNVSGELQLADAFTAASGSNNSYIKVFSGTFTTNNFTLSTWAFAISAGLSKTVNCGSSVWNVIGASVFAWAISDAVTWNKGTCQINLIGGNQDFIGGSITYYILNIADGGLKRMNNANATFYDIQSSYTATGSANLQIRATPINVENFTAQGTSALKTFNLSNSNLVYKAINKIGTGIVSTDYLSISNLQFTPFATNGTLPYVWYAGDNSINGGGTSGILYKSNVSNLSNAYLIDSGTSWTVPTDFSNTNSIYIFGGGGGGGGGRSGSATNKAGGGGGGGGGYTALTNQTLSGTVTYAIGAGGTAGAINGGTGGTGGTTSWNAGASTATGGTGGSTTATPSSVGGIGGTGSQTGGAGGAGSTTTTSGSAVAGGGGGGSAGPNGTGGAGGLGFTNAAAQGNGGGGGGNGGGTAGGAASTSVGGTGGNNSLGAGGGAASSAGTNGGGGGGGTAANGGSGGVGVDIFKTVGGGGGSGGGAAASGVGINAIGYSAGGSGAGSNTSLGNGVGGIGSQGMIFILYTRGSMVTNNGNFFFLIN